MWILNVSKEDIETGTHPIPDEQTMLIQIVDPAMFYPTPKYPFKEIYQFEFLDFEGPDDPFIKPGMEDFLITDAQATALTNCLQNALNTSKNVIVHCVAGIARSGGVVEVGIRMGFTDTDKYRKPNKLVVDKMLHTLNNLQIESSYEPII